MINTFDVDFHRFDSGYIVSSSEYADMVLCAVRRCNRVRRVEWRISASQNGYHIRVHCAGDGCDSCRLVFDSPYRFAMDQRRPQWTRDVLWDRKHYFKGGGCLGLDAGEWETVYE